MVINSAVESIIKLPARFTIPASDGADTLVPPNTCQPVRPRHRVLSKTETPLLGSASKEKSGAERCVASVPVIPIWYVGFDSNALGPPPLPLQPVSLVKLPFASRCTLVPPAETTDGETLG